MRAVMTSGSWGGCIYDVARAVLEGSARELAQARGIPFQFRLYLQHMVRRQEATIRTIESDAKRLPVAQDLFRGGVAEVFGQCIVLKEFVMRRDDVLDRRTVLGFLQSKCVDEDALIRNRRGNALEFREFAAGQRQCL